MAARQSGAAKAPRHVPDGAGAGKAPTGIRGLDAATGGGLPVGRTSLVEGGPGAGKTVLALQSLVHAARQLGEPTILVAFEESAASIRANAARFGWDLERLQADRLFILDAQPSYDLISSGASDLDGLLAGLDAKVRQIGARRIVFDAIDVVLQHVGDATAERRELYRLHDWLLSRGLTAIITCKTRSEGMGRQMGELLQFMVDCTLVLDHRVVEGVSQRSLRVRKYRGSAFNENEVPMIIGAAGLEVACIDGPARAHAPVSNERLSTGVPRLDTMLGGGIFRGASVLLTGTPGTAKTTLCGAFAQAACERGDPTLFISFDSAAEEVVRNLRSVGLRLARFLPKARQPGGRAASRSSASAGLLRMAYLRAVIGSAETQLLQIQALAREHGARCVVVDPVSALVRLGQGGSGHGVAERLIDWVKAEGITLMCSSLLGGGLPEQESTPLQISTIADTWLHLHYRVSGGERNRGLSIVKSRGTAHSNQVRELLLSGSGITLADTYAAGGEVLMGTLRWEREQAEAASARDAEAERQATRANLQAEQAELMAQLQELQRQIGLRQAGLQMLGIDTQQRQVRAGDDGLARKRRRQADAEVLAGTPEPVPPRHGGPARKPRTASRGAAP